MPIPTTTDDRAYPGMRVAHLGSPRCGTIIEAGDGALLLQMTDGALERMSIDVFQEHYAPLDGRPRWPLPCSIEVHRAGVRRVLLEGDRP